MRLIRAAAIFSGLFLFATCLASAALAQQAAPLSDEELEDLRSERDRLWDQAVALERQGKLAEAAVTGEKMLEIERRALGDDHEEVASSWEWLAELRERLEQFEPAKDARREALKIKTQLLGKEHWEVTEARLALENVDVLARLNVDQRRQLTDLAEQNSAVVRLYREGKPREALDAATRNLELCRRLLGEQHPDIATMLNNLAGLHHALGDYTKAEKLYKESVRISESALGENHPSTAQRLDNLGALYYLMADYAQAATFHQRSLEIRMKMLGEDDADTANSIDNLAGVYNVLGEYAKAEPLYKQSLLIRRKVLGDEHADVGLSKNNLAFMYFTKGDYAQAEPLYAESLESWKQSLGEDHPRVSLALNNLAALYYTTGDYGRAESLYNECLEIRERLLGKEHPDTAVSLSNLGTLYVAMGHYAAAEPVFRRTLETNERMLGKEHPNTATSLNNLAFVYKLTGDYAQAEPLYRDSLAYCQSTLAENHPETAACLNNLAGLRHAMGAAAEAESLYTQSLEIYRTFFHDEHPSVAISLNNLAALHYSAGDYGKAEPLCRQALEISRHNLELASYVQSQRRQLAMARAVRYELDSYVTFAVRSGEFGESAYEQVATWKGMVLARQQAARAVADRPELQPTFAELQSVCTQLATLAFSTSTGDDSQAWRERMAQLSQRKERLEAQLAQQSAAFGDAIQPAKLDQVRAALPPDAVLIDFLEYTYSQPKTERSQVGWEFDRRLAAFVVSKSSEVKLLDLGPVAPLSEAIDKWRLGLGRTASSNEAGQFLREKIWSPIEERFARASDSPPNETNSPIRTVLISPDGVLGRLPLGALPGRQPGTYLLEEWPIAAVPSPQSLVSLVGSLPELRPVEKGANRAGGKLLVLGGVDYDSRTEESPIELAHASPAARAPRDDDHTFLPLAGTQAELTAIEQIYRGTFDASGVRAISGAAATEVAIRREAPGCRFLHLATHGFFAAEKYRSALERSAHELRSGQELLADQTISGYHPGLLSGLALAGANKPDADDDGILTADEVAALNLSGAELVVLSACETGLGRSEGGEGLLGLQRSFQAAGARTVIASLWKVDDRATRDLMERFYDNLWKENMGKLEALREAQLWMLHGGQTGPTGERGLKPLPGKVKTPNIERLPPYYWAAFVLSGDWR